MHILSFSQLVWGGYQILEIIYGLQKLKTFSSFSIILVCVLNKFYSRIMIEKKEVILHFECFIRFKKEVHRG